MGINLKKLQQKKERTGGGKFWTINKEGEFFIKLLPLRADFFEGVEHDDIAYELKAHYRVSEEHKFLVCPRTPHIGKPCPICKKVSALFNTEIKQNIQIARDIKAVKRYYMNILVLPSGNPDEWVKKLDVVQFETNTTIYDEITTHMIDYNEYDFVGLKSPFFKVVRKQKGQWPDYSVKPIFNVIDFSKYIQDDYLDRLDELFDALEPAKSYEELEQILIDGGLLNDAVLPTSTVAAPPKQRKTIKPVNDNIDEDDQFIETDEDDDDDIELTNPVEESEEEIIEEPKPKKSTPKKKKSGKPDCFGEKFNSKNDKCKACSYMKECRKAWLEALDDDDF